jgi:hypothetical protein
MYLFIAFFGALSSFSLNTWPTHWSLLNLILLVSSITLYKLYRVIKKSLCTWWL